MKTQSQTSKMVARDFFRLCVDEISHGNLSRVPLLSWDLSNPSRAYTDDQEVLREYAKIYHWKFDVTGVLRANYEALVLTDASQTILWANKGFEKMTGYTVDYAVGLKPDFLQGPKTSGESRRDISQNLRRKEPFKSVIVNYKKSGEEYLCEVRVIPIADATNQVTHFLALERAI